MTDKASAKAPQTAKSDGNQKNVPAERSRRPYRSVLSHQEQIEFERLGNLGDIDDEITLVRVKLRRLLRKQPDNTLLITHTVRTLALLVKIRHGLTDKKSTNMKEAINVIFKELAGPLGVN